MPSKSKAQARLMAAVAHGWHKPGGGGPSVKVAKEFNRADKGRHFAKGGLATLRELLAESGEAAKARMIRESEFGKLPQGMFSPLDELIQQQAFETAPPHQWIGALKPGKILERGGTKFPLKQEELDFTGLSSALSKLQQQMLEQSKDPRPRTRAEAVASNWDDVWKHYGIPAEKRVDPLAAYHDVLNNESPLPWEAHQAVFDHMMEQRYLAKEQELGRPLTIGEMGDLQKEEYGRYRTYPGNEHIPEDADDALARRHNEPLGYDVDQWLGKFEEHAVNTAGDPERQFVLSSRTDEPSLPSMTTGGLRKEDLLAWLRTNRPGLEQVQKTAHGSYVPPWMADIGAYPSVTKITGLPLNSPITDELGREQHFDDAHSWNRSNQIRTPKGDKGRMVVEVQSDPHRRATDLIATPPPDLLEKAQALLDHPGAPETLRDRITGSLGERVVGTRGNENELPGWGTRRRGYGTPDPTDEMRQQPVSDLMPFQGIKGYGMLELKNALNRALGEDSDFLGLASGQDQEDIYKHLQGRQIHGMHSVYDPMVTKKDPVTGVESQQPGIYAQLLRNLAKQYNIPYDPEFAVGLKDSPAPRRMSDPAYWNPLSRVQGDGIPHGVNGAETAGRHVENFMDEFDPELYDEGNDAAMGRGVDREVLQDNHRALSRLHRFVYGSRRQAIATIEELHDHGLISDDDMAEARSHAENLSSFQRALGAAMEEEHMDASDFTPGLPDVTEAHEAFDKILEKGKAAYMANNPVEQPDSNLIKRQALILNPGDRERLRRTGISPWMLAAGAAGLGAMEQVQQPDDSQPEQGFDKGGLARFSKYNQRGLIHAVKNLPTDDLVRATQLFDRSPSMLNLITPASLRRLFPGNQVPIALLKPEEFQKLAYPLDLDSEELMKISGLAAKINDQGLRDPAGLTYTPGRPINNKIAANITGHEGRHRSYALQQLDEEYLPTALVPPLKELNDPWDDADSEAFYNWYLKKKAPYATDLDDSLSYLKSVKTFRPEARTKGFEAGDESAPLLKNVLGDRLFAKGGLAESDRPGWLRRVLAQMESEWSTIDSRDQPHLFGIGQKEVWDSPVEQHIAEDRSSGVDPRFLHTQMQMMDHPMQASTRLENDTLGIPAGIRDLKDAVVAKAQQKAADLHDRWEPYHDTIHTLGKLVADKIKTVDDEDDVPKKASMAPDVARLLELSERAAARGEAIRQAVMLKRGIPEAQGLGERLADTAGEMLGQIPVPGAWSKMPSEGLGALKAIAEYLGPTVSHWSGYPIGTAGGTLLSEGAHALLGSDGGSNPPKP